MIMASPAYHLLPMRTLFTSTSFVLTEACRMVPPAANDSLTKVRPPRRPRWAVLHNTWLRVVQLHSTAQDPLAARITGVFPPFVHRPGWALLALTVHLHRLLNQKSTSLQRIGKDRPRYLEIHLLALLNLMSYQRSALLSFQTSYLKNPYQRLSSIPLHHHTALTAYSRHEWEKEYMKATRFHCLVNMSLGPAETHSCMPAMAHHGEFHPSQTTLTLNRFMRLPLGPETRKDIGQEVRY